MWAQNSVQPGIQLSYRHLRAHIGKTGRLFDFVRVVCRPWNNRKLCPIG